MSEQGKILIVDDHPANIEILCKILQQDFELATATNGQECLEMVRQLGPDLVLLDIMMPQMDGYEACRRIKSSPVGPFTQVILISGKGSTADRLRGYDSHADDYVVKPFDHDELLSKVRVQFRLRESQLKAWELNLQIQEYSRELERLVAERTAQLSAAQDTTVLALAQLADSRDTDTGEHLIRIRSYAQILAEELRRRGPYKKEIDQFFLESLYRSSPLHDIGKVGIADSILKKPGRLTSEEFEAMKHHVVIGAETLERAGLETGDGCFLAMAAQIARYHHEWFDGTGYCAGIGGHDIPLAARIVSLADVYDALTSTRVYKPAFAPVVAKRMIEEESGTHFDPEVARAFQECFERFLTVQESDQSLTEQSLCADDACI